MFVISVEQALSLTLLPFLIECIFGYPNWMLRKISHPIIWLGGLLNWLEDRCDKHRTLLSGFIATTIVVTAAGVIGVFLQTLALNSTAAFVCITILTSSLFATRSLWQHVKDIEDALVQDADLAIARTKLSKIVSRNTSALNQSEICSSALESLSENTSDAVTAPLLWTLALGLPGLFVYKAINTLDSMWGYRNSRYEQFGKFAAKLDDIANYIPARVTAFVVLAISKRINLLRQLQTEAKTHNSPNAGWPEAAYALALDVRLGGEFDYGQAKQSHAILNLNASAPSADHLHKGLRLYIHSIAAMVALILILGIL